MIVTAECSVLILGSGIAGLSYAAKLPHDESVVILTKKRPAESNTNYAQGGIASVIGAEDSYDLHVEDTMRAGAGLCREDAVRVLVNEGPERIRDLMEFGAQFTRTNDGTLELGLEGGHSRRRIVHAKDLTGREIERALLAEVASRKNVRMLENHFALDLWIDRDPREGNLRCYGATYLDPRSGEVCAVRARRTLLSTGGCGKVYLYTTNPDIATGDGVAMAARAGCSIVNLEFVQFHPTCLYHPEAKSFLISEAVRGEGAVLRNLAGEDFMLGKHPLGSLAPRDIVAREIDRQMKRRGDKCVFLDCTSIGDDAFAARFPTIDERLRHFGFRPGKDLIPVVPAAHYMCGGVQVDLWGRTQIQELYAVGEVACTGVHGANRLASNSLLEAIVFAHRASAIPLPSDRGGDPPAPVGPPVTRPRGAREDIGVIVDHDWDAARRLLWDYVGLVRSRERLERAVERLRIFHRDVEGMFQDSPPTADLGELRNVVQVGLLLAAAAKSRQESRGLHFLQDHPDPVDPPRESWARWVGGEVQVELQPLAPPEGKARTS